MIIAGLDEAGRGPVIGPFVIGCVVIKESELHVLDEIVVDDSKKISPKKRAILVEKIKNISLAYKSLIISPQEINDLHYSKHITLNQIEEQKFAELLNSMKPTPDVIYLDAADTVEDRFGITIKALLTFTPDKVISKHRGDAIFKIVGASSILAKTVRDQEIEKYKIQYGDFGSGYPSDPKTKRFLKEYYGKNQKFPPFVRTWWKTAENIVTAYKEGRTQKKITDF
ncbi:MAG: ribonuclease HII [Promethearchaeota archaeon]|nr:MAG: ribonuclease HII [Candidatus Lokiarchaeota archaeon]